MTELDDHELLAEYARTESEAAFATLVARYVNLVHSAAWRFTGNPHHAEEITQAVFVILARKAGGLRRGTVLSGWLYQTARLTAANFVKGEIRRQKREQEAFMQSTLTESDPAAWEQIAPLLDEAMGCLGETDRNAVVLRFFENKTARQVAAALRLSEAAAHKRVDRALEKLRHFFFKRGVALPAAVVTTAITANSVQAAPVALAKSVTAVAMAKGAAASGSTLTLIKGALKIMAWTKAKTTVVTTVGILLAAGTTVVTVNHIKAHESWRVQNISSEMVDNAAPQVRILPTKFPSGSELVRANAAFDKFVGINVSVADIAGFAYRGEGLPWPSKKIRFATVQPPGRYDFIATLPHGASEALQQELKSKFGLVGRREMKDLDVLLLKVRNPNAPQLKPSTGQPGNLSATTDGGHGSIKCENQPLSTVAAVLEQMFNLPVKDQTGLTDQYSFELTWNERGEQDPNHNALKQALLNQLGLQLAPGREPIEMLVMEKTN